MRFSLACLATVILLGCSTPEPAPAPIATPTEADAFFEDLKVTANKEHHKETIDRLAVELPREFSNTGYVACFNGMDAIMVREFLGEIGGVVWSNGVYLPSVFTSFMRTQHPPDGLPSIGLAVQDNVVVGTVVKIKDKEK